MNDLQNLRDLYQEVIIDHSRHPRNYCELATANHQAEGFNRLCGDQLTLYLDVDQNVIKNISFKGTGCAISTASASLMTECLKGKTQKEALDLFAAFHELLTAKQPSTDLPNLLGKLNVLAGVREFPARVKCATLAWHTLQAALNQNEGSVSTEE